MIGERLKEARRLKGLTQQQLADLLHVKNNTVSDWERGISEPDVDQINLICSILDIDHNWLFNNPGKLPTNDATLKFLHDHSVHELPEEAKKEIDLMIEFVKSKYSKPQGR